MKRYAVTRDHSFARGGASSVRRRKDCTRAYGKTRKHRRCDREHAGRVHRDIDRALAEQLQPTTSAMGQIADSDGINTTTSGNWHR
jgi:hypothetical protein